jgi:hypothetical protein
MHKKGVNLPPPDPLPGVWGREGPIKLYPYLLAFITLVRKHYGEKTNNGFYFSPATGKMNGKPSFPKLHPLMEFLAIVARAYKR